MQRFNVIAYRGKHTAHLMVAAFGKCQTNTCVAQRFHCDGLERLGFRLKQHCPAGEQLAFVTPYGVRERRFVHLGQMCFR